MQRYSLKSRDKALKTSEERMLPTFICKFNFPFLLCFLVLWSWNGQFLMRTFCWSSSGWRWQMSTEKS